MGYLNADNLSCEAFEWHTHDAVKSVTKENQQPKVVSPVKLEKAMLETSGLSFCIFQHKTEYYRLNGWEIWKLKSTHHKVAKVEKY